MIEDKIISDVLIYLDGWELQNKEHKKRHKPHPPKYLDAFNEDTEDVENTNIRKTVKAKEILGMYEIAKMHVLNYIRRPVFPRTPVTHVALCMWTAGLLSQKARFRKQRIENSYNLINEAKKLLKPHIDHRPSISTISGKDAHYDDDIENYRICHEPNPKCKKHHKKHPCVSEYPQHHKPHKHHHHKPHFEYDEPEYDEFFLNPHHTILKIASTKTSGDGTITLRAIIRDKYGNRQDEGQVVFYLENNSDSTDEFEIKPIRTYIGTAYIENGTATYTWSPTPETPLGKQTIYATFQQTDEYVSASAYADIEIKNGTHITIDDVDTSPSRTNTPLTAHIQDLNNTNVNEGKLQFYLDKIPVEATCDVIDGLATFILPQLPEHVKDNTNITCMYLGTELYAENIEQQPGLIHLYPDISIEYTPFSINPTEMAHITFSLHETGSENIITTGNVAVYVDNQMINSGELIDEQGNVVIDYDSSNLDEGEHILQIIYEGNGNSITYESSFIIRQSITTFVIDDVEGSLGESMTITSHLECNGEPVNQGQVIYKIETDD